ncbi:MAG: RluA family pseudouridine synthase [Sphaerochaetaceae bacterium]|nr:RluA family pseudouridine synthase [Sphaerochaetaceae bacterium]
MINNSILPSEIAEKELLKMFDEFDKNKYIYEGYPTAPLFEKVGVMFGILICENSKKERITLKAFSGQFCGRWLVPTFVPPLLDVEGFEKVVNNYDPETKALTEKIVKLDPTDDKEEIEGLCTKRQERSKITLAKIIDLYKFPTIDNRTLTLKEIVNNKTYPSGTGDCCAPKLFGYAFEHNLQPISLAESFYGKDTKLKKHKHFYPPCKEKCSIVLPTMLGLDILYCDDYITVVNKPAGLVTIPGRAPELKDCITSRLKKLFPDSIDLSAAHRLDMDTSGIIILGRTKEAHRNLSIQFQERQVKKTYLALVRGVVKEKEGTIELPLRLDVDNRPTQIVDTEKGKSAKTEFQRLAVEYYGSRYATRLLLKPYTGRTHQLRVHCKEKLFPIIGDRLYGERKEGESRMLLQANYISFKHPITGEEMEFSIPPEF